MTGARASQLFCDLVFVSHASCTDACLLSHPAFYLQSLPFSGHTPFPVIPAHLLMSYLLSKSASFLSCLHPELVVECLDQGGCLMFKERLAGTKLSKLKM